MKNKQSKSRPIIFNSEMVNAILDGRKFQTRRVIKPQPIPVCCENYTSNCFDEPPECCGIPDIEPVKYPYGKIGDRLWVRETYTEWLGAELYYAYKADYLNEERTFIENRVSKYQVDGFSISKNRWRSPAIMPKLASRLTLEITDIKVERLQDIDENPFVWVISFRRAKDE